MDVLKESKDEYSKKFSSNTVNSADDIYQTATVKIKTNLGTKYRKIYILSSNLTKIKNIYYNNNEYRKLYTNLPKANIGSIEIRLGTKNLYNEHLPKNIIVDIYEKVREEIAQGDFNQIYEILNTVSSSSITLSYSYYDDHGYQYARIPLQPNIMPKAYEMFLEHFYTNSAENRNEIREILKNYNNYNPKEYNISIQYYKGETTNAYSSYFALNPTTASFIINNEKEGVPKIGDSFVFISVSYQTPGNQLKRLETIINLGDTDVNNIFNSY